MWIFNVPLESGSSSVQQARPCKIGLAARASYNPNTIDIVTLQLAAGLWLGEKA